MRKIVLSLFVLILAVSLTTAQNAQLKWGVKTFSKNILKGDFRLLSLSDGGVMALAPVPSPTMTSTSIALLKFDANLSYVGLTKIPLVSGDKKLQYQFVVRMKDKVLVFSTLPDRKAGKQHFYYNIFDPATQKLSATATEVFTVPLDKSPFPTQGSLSYRQSLDSTKLALIYTPPQKFADKEKFCLTVLDESLQTVFTRQDPLTFSGKNFDIRLTALSNSGVVYIAGVVTTGPRKPFSKTQDNWEYVILQISGESPPEEIKVNFRGQYITDLALTCDLDNNLVLAGFYSQKGVGVKGAYYYLFDGNNGAELEYSSREFDMAFVTEGLTDKEAERLENKADKGKNVEMPDYDIDDIIIRSDNGLYMVAEQFYSVTVTYTNSNGSTSTKTTYYGKFIIVVGISPAGEIDVTRKVVKAQKSSDVTMIGYIMSRKGDDLYFVFTDNPLNNAPHPQKANWASFMGNGCTTIAHMRPDGSLERKNLYEFKKNPFYVLPYMSYGFNDGRILSITLAGMKYKMLLITPE